MITSVSGFGDYARSRGCPDGASAIPLERTCLAEAEFGAAGIEPLTEAQILGAMGQEYRDRVARQLSEDDFRYLKVFAREGDAYPGGFRVTEVKGWLEVSQAGASRIVGRLLAARMLRRSGRAGKSVYYQLTGAASIAARPMG